MKENEKFVASYIAECRRGGATEEEIRRNLHVVYSFLARGLFGFYKATKQKDIKVCLNEFADAVNEVAEGMLAIE
ncbi:hypothetical protein [Leptospira santarosai]|uniref:hypothetical protein n=1 Tax=Leptospira santarosai TaxID=28183 RepID=UPI0009598931|nr:hypothetical protein [Leptospira santarosai]MDI7189089.1 hypothetical protein [Leptospira santarosai]MDI7219459.1 hypothetical protein [Leptospira santarosai]MDI7221224.1 hypothetical protein [Leptospira santarosai]OLY58693.1 hypothetical protein BV917_20030 [Leptospira santarosai serovar Guaricura]